MLYSSKRHPDSVLDILICQIFNSSKDHRSSKSIIYKILFDLKNHLASDNPIKNNLSFYWYYYGPNSDSIKEHIDSMEIRGILDKQVLPNGWPLLHLKNEINNFECAGLEEAQIKLSKILEDFDFSKTGEYREYIYRKYAPFSFMNTYKQDFLKHLKSFNKKIQRRIILEDNENEEEILKEFSILEKLLFDSEVELSVDPIFEDFQETFSSYATGTYRIIENNVDETDFLKLNLKNQTLDLLNESTWKTFALGVRIPEIGHDSYYNDKVPEWSEKFNNSFVEYDTLVDDYYDQSIDFINLNRLKIRILNSQSKSILSSSIYGYLGYGE